MLQCFAGKRLLEWIVDYDIWRADESAGPMLQLGGDCVGGMVKPVPILNWFL
jgi:hypothetical protein